MYQVVDRSNTHMLTCDEWEANFPEDFLQCTSPEFTPIATESDDQVDFASMTRGVKEATFENSQGPLDLNTVSASASIKKHKIQPNNQSSHFVFNEGASQSDQTFFGRFGTNTTPDARLLTRFSFGNPNQAMNQVNIRSNDSLALYDEEDEKFLQRFHEPLDRILPPITPWFHQPDSSIETSAESNLINYTTIGNTTAEQTIQTITVAPVYQTFEMNSIPSAEKPDQFCFEGPIQGTSRIDNRQYDHLMMGVGNNANCLKRSHEPIDEVLPLETPWSKQAKFSTGTSPESNQITSVAVERTTTVPAAEKKLCHLPIPITAEMINNKLNHPVLLDIDTATVVENIKDWLCSNNITQELFASQVLNLSRKAAWKFFYDPVPWTTMRSGKWVYTRMYNFLNMNPEMQTETFKLDLYQNKTTYAPLK